jgi:hypothetical protein
VELPLWIQWVNLGYYNKDIQYNFAGLTQIELAAGPHWIPYQSIFSSYSGSGTAQLDTSNEMTGGWVVQAYAYHYFPIFRYASFGLGTQNMWQSFGDALLDPQDKLGGASTGYLNSSVTTELNFPIVRNINWGKPYLDALYGTVAYEVSFYGNKTFFTNGTMRILQEEMQGFDRDSSLMVSHTVSAGLKLGMIRAHAFSLMPTTTISYEILSKKLRVDASLSF